MARMTFAKPGAAAKSASTQPATAAATPPPADTTPAVATTAAPAPDPTDSVQVQAGVAVTTEGEVVPTEVTPPPPISPGTAKRGTAFKKATPKPAPAAPAKAATPKAAGVSPAQTATGATVADPAAAASSQVPAVRPMAGGLVKEDSDWISLEDIVLPRINIAQRVGEVGDNFEKGSIVLGKAIVVGDPENPAEVVFIGFREPQYVTVVKGGLGEILSRKEFLEMNGTVSREEAEGNEDKVLCQKLFTALVAVRAPETSSDTSAFPYEYTPEAGNEKDEALAGNYALALASFKGGSYHQCAKIVLSHRRLGPLMKGFTYRMFQLAVEDKLYKQTGNKAFAFKLGANVETTPAFREWLKKVLDVSRDEDSGEAAE